MAAEEIDIYQLPDPNQPQQAGAGQPSSTFGYGQTGDLASTIRDIVLSLLDNYDGLIRLGAGNQVINIQKNQGIWIGDANFADAPFSVDMDGNAVAGTLVTDQLNIPDENVTDNSMHVETDGDTWWGCTHTNFTSNNDNALAYILKTGQAKFQKVVITSTPTVISDITAKVSPVRTYTAGDPLVAGNAAILANSSTSDKTLLSQTTIVGTAEFGNSSGSNRKYADTFSPSESGGLTRITTRLQAISGGYGGSVQITIQADSAGAPSGVVLGTATKASVSTSMTEYDVDFVAPVGLTSGITYWIVYESTVSGERYRLNVSGAGTSYEYNGTVWNLQVGEVYLVLKNIIVDGYLYLADASAAGTSDGFIGFIQTGASPGGTAQVQIADVFSGLSGLTTGSIYYLSDTAGAISASAGTVTKKVGRAVSATELQIIYTI